ncbi:MAG: hypothetical protein JWL59_311 [Chthoniobacteraceae bacterium]|nr:hypothetical protein [Chthoniobacteraceae bacterium]
MSEQSAFPRAAEGESADEAAEFGVPGLAEIQERSHLIRRRNVRIARVGAHFLDGLQVLGEMSRKESLGDKVGHEFAEIKHKLIEAGGPLVGGFELGPESGRAKQFDLGPGIQRADVHVPGFSNGPDDLQERPVIRALAGFRFRTRTRQKFVKPGGFLVKVAAVNGSKSGCYRFRCRGGGDLVHFALQPCEVVGDPRQAILLEKSDRLFAFLQLPEAPEGLPAHRGSKGAPLSAFKPVIDFASPVEVSVAVVMERTRLFTATDFGAGTP